MKAVPQEELERRLALPVEDALQASTHLATAASARRVNRTHRLVRERAQKLQARQSFLRSLWVPLGVCSGLVLLLCGAVWSLLDQYDVEPTGMPDPSQQMLVLLMWCLPLTAIVLALVWFRRIGTRTENERRS